MIYLKDLQIERHARHAMHRQEVREYFPHEPIWRDLLLVNRLGQPKTAEVLT